MELGYINYYNDKPVRTTNLAGSYRIESKTRQFPFVVASDIDNSNKIVDENDPSGTREFFVFHDLEHFLCKRDEYPNSHEIIRTPSTVEYDNGASKKIYRDDLCKGRLIFDFDCEEPINDYCKPICISGDPSTLVPQNFKQVIEILILKVFQTYYVNVDVSKFVFIWQNSKNSKKFSMHLIVKNAYFSEYWVKQMKIFYELMKRVAYQHDVLDYTKPIDFQIPHRNSTFRLIGSCKVGREPLEFDSYSVYDSNMIKLSKPMDITIYDCLVGLYDLSNLTSEQTITMDGINYNELEEQIQESLESSNSELEIQFRKTIEKNLRLVEDEIKIDLVDSDLENAMKLFTAWNDGCFEIRDHVKNIINLNRVKRSACRISGVVHDRENAYLKLTDDGCVKFICRRGCNCNGSYSINIGSFRQTSKRPFGIYAMNKQRINLAKSASTIIVAPVKSKSPTPQSAPLKNKKSTSTSAKRCAIGITVVQVPASLRK